MRRILFVLILFLAAKQFVAPASLSRFLSEDTSVTTTNHTDTSTADPLHGDTASHGSGHEGGIELSYAVGTKGFYICIIISIILTCIAGIMSGLTVGLLSIDTLELEMKMLHGTDEQK